MKYSVLAVLTLLLSTAVAGPHDDLASARQKVQTATSSVSYYETQVTIAERDVATARIHQDTATKARAAAQRDRNSALASDWARRHDAAVKAEREALARAERSRQERDRANTDLVASTSRVKQLETRTRASR